MTQQVGSDWFQTSKRIRCDECNVTKRTETSAERVWELAQDTDPDTERLDLNLRLPLRLLRAAFVAKLFWFHFFPSAFSGSQLTSCAQVRVASERGNSVRIGFGSARWGGKHNMRAVNIPTLVAAFGARQRWRKFSGNATCWYVVVVANSAAVSICCSVVQFPCTKLSKKNSLPNTCGFSLQSF